MRASACLLLASTAGLAQTVSPGAVAGVPLTELIVSAADRVAVTSRYTFGPTLSLSLWRGFGVDAGFLYRRAGFGFKQAAARAAVHRWELPVLVRYGFPGAGWRPFVHAGVSFNHVFRISGADPCGRGAFGEQFYCIGGLPVAELRHRGTEGLVIGAGVERSVAKLRLLPEIRVTRWKDRNFGVRDAPLRSNLSELEVLLGARF